jgi:glutamine amidotransferase
VIQVTVVDYGAGNLASVVKALRAVGGNPLIATCPSDLLTDQARTCQAVVIPGVGHFEATRALDAPWKAAVRERIDAGVPLLGICLGMQWLYDGSEEAPDLEGLGVFAGTCRRIEGAGIKVPHVGWNTLDFPGSEDPGLHSSRDIHTNFAYFTHSYAAPITDDTVSETTHGVTFASTVARGRVWGAQWHPEKSGDTGLRYLRDFLQLAPNLAPHLTKDGR